MHRDEDAPQNAYRVRTWAAGASLDNLIWLQMAEHLMKPHNSGPYPCKLKHLQTSLSRLCPDVPGYTLISGFIRAFESPGYLNQKDSRYLRSTVRLRLLFF